MYEKMEFPIIKALEFYRSNNTIKMHMPGHKGGKGFPDWFIKNLINYDLTEIPGLDNFHNPEGAIKESLENCAKAFGAKKSFFLVNGSTSGIHAMLLSALNKGDKLLIQRDCHQSVINGLILFGIQPVFIMPEFDSKWQIKIPAKISAWEEAIAENPDAKGALITSPDYYGLCAHLAELAELLHKKGKFLLVDEAHGAHFAFSGKLPPTALEQGADLCVQSMHKTMPSLTQAAILHMGETLISEDRVKRAVSMLTTTSPSYMLMASIEYAAEYAVLYGEDRYGELVGALGDIKNELGKMKRLRLMPDSIHGIERDPTRIVADTAFSDISGYELYNRLYKDYNIVAEMSDESRVVFIMTVADTGEDAEKLKNSLISLDKKLKASSRNKHFQYPYKQKQYPVPELSGYLGRCLEIPLNKSEGFICAEIITPYPPGVPYLCPGEIITLEHIISLCNMISAGSKINGLIVSENEADIRVRVFQK